MPEELEAIKKRDAEAGALWFSGPASFTALAVRDRRALLAALAELHAEGTESYTKEKP